MTQLSLPRSLRLTIASLALLALSLATLAPILAARGHVEAVGLYIALEPLCHQRTERSWSFGELPAGLCIRCFGIYGGIAAAALLRLPFSRRLALAGVATLAAAWALEHIAGAPLPEAARFASGGALGLALASVTTSSGMAGSQRPETARGAAASNI